MKQTKEKPEVVTRTLPVAMTEEEELQLGQNIAELQLSINRLSLK